MGLTCPGASADAASSAEDPRWGSCARLHPFRGVSRGSHPLVIPLRDAKGELRSSQTSRTDYLRTFPFNLPTGSVPPLVQAGYLACLYLRWRMRGEDRGRQTENRHDRSQCTQLSRNRQLLTGKSAQWKLFYDCAQPRI